MEKLTGLELEKLQNLQAKEQELNELKFKLGDSIVQLELNKGTVLNKAVEFMNESRPYFEEITKKYGTDFSVGPNGEILKSDIQQQGEEV